MEKSGRIVRYTVDELREMCERGESKSDWEQAAAMTEEEIAAAIASDPDEAGMVIDWSTTSAELPQPEKVLNMRIDADVLQFFRREGKGYQTKINAVLRSYVEQQRRPVASG
ncbi:MAG: BrnA antitoxin family protein [Chlorobium sp.]